MGRNSITCTFGAAKLCMDKDKGYGLGTTHLTEIIKTKNVQLISRISHQWFTQNVFKKLENLASSPNDRGLTC